MSFNIYKPEVFQGNLNKENYFEGWYFKHVSSDLRTVYAFIPGISINKEDPHAFIQVLNGITGQSDYITYPVKEFTWRTDKLYVRVGTSVFSDRYINLDINSGDTRITGLLEYLDVVRYPKKLLSPGIMGWYSFVPFMECKHGVVSVNHELKGKLKINDTTIDFKNGKGYIEKDWGISFPEAWLWLQANNFSDTASSFCFSVAKIPWRGKFFIGFIAFLYYKGKFHLFSTYNGSEIKEIRRNGSTVFLVLKNRKNILKVNAASRKGGELKAPVMGKMTRKIKEGNDTTVSIALYDLKDKVLYTDTSKRGGLEIIDKLFEYI
jgi:hypothetical protein